jgi:hypothetical protein
MHLAGAGQGGSIYVCPCHARHACVACFVCNCVCSVAHNLLSLRPSGSCWRKKHQICASRACQQAMCCLPCVVIVCSAAPPALCCWCNKRQTCNSSLPRYAGFEHLWCSLPSTCVSAVRHISVSSPSVLPPIWQVLKKEALYMCVRFMLGNACAACFVCDCVCSVPRHLLCCHPSGRC